MNRNNSRRGNAVLETALIFVPFVFLLLGVMELGRAMWMYHTFASAVKAGTRFAIVHGEDCVEAAAACQATVGDIASAIRRSGPGLDRGAMQLTLTAGGVTRNCATLTACESDQTAWPPSPYNGSGRLISISGTYNFSAVVSALWPGQPLALNYRTKSTEMIQF